MPRGKESTAEQIIGKPREAEVLAREVFNTLLEAKVLIERWRRHYNTARPHSSLDYRPPAPEARPAVQPASATLPQAERLRNLAQETLT